MIRFVLGLIVGFAFCAMVIIPPFSAECTKTGNLKLRIAELKYDSTAQASEINELIITRNSKLKVVKYTN